MTPALDRAGRADLATEVAAEPLPWLRIALLAAAVAILAPLVRAEVSARLAPPSSAPASPLVLLPPSGVDSIPVRGEDVAGRFERSGEGWTFTPEGGAPRTVDADVPGEFLRTLAGLTRLTQFVDQDPAAFGLERPRGSFALGGDSGVRVDIGDRNPTLTAVYLRLPPQPDVVLVGSVLLWEWDKLLGAARRSTAGDDGEAGSR